MRTETYNISLVDLPSHMSYLSSLSDILNAGDTHAWLCRQKNMIGWTYSITSECWRTYSFARLITGRPFDDPKVRHAANNHMKVYIATTGMLIGSYNLTAPTIEDCCILVSKKNLVRHMRQQFEHQWKSLK